MFSVKIRPSFGDICEIVPFPIRTRMKKERQRHGLFARANHSERGAPFRRRPIRARYFLLRFVDITLNQGRNRSFRLLFVLREEKRVDMKFLESIHV